MRIDGNVTVYVIQHVHPNTIQKGWDGKSWNGTGDCSQFPRKNGSQEKNHDLYRCLSANGDTWQKYGIHGTEKESEAVAVMLDMRRVYPEYHWAVTKLELSQKTSLVFKAEATA